MSSAERRSRFAVVVARFYEELAARLLAGARRAFDEAGVVADAVDTFDVPGSFELPLAAKVCAEAGPYLAVVCLGAVIRGETNHYDHVCNQAAAGIQRVALDTGVPCSFGVITCDTMEQALARTGGDMRDQGYNAARTAMQMADLLESLRG